MESSFVEVDVKLKKKVLFVTPSLRQGGVEHSLITALRVLDPSKYDITLYLYTDMLDLLSQVPEYVNVIVGMDKTRYFRKPLPLLFTILYQLMMFFKLDKQAKKINEITYSYIHKKKIVYPSKRYFKNVDFDSIVSYSLHIGTEMALKIKANNYYVFMHSSDPNYHNKTALKTFDKYNKIVFVSDAVKRVHENLYSQFIDKMTVINNYIDAERIINMSVSKVSIDNSKDVILCTCGRLSKEKGFDLAVESANILNQKGINFIWYFVGDGDEKSSLEKKISDYNLDKRITITGYQENPFSYIRACDIYIQPSYEEAQPLTILEAMVIGKPIISTKTVGGKNILKNGKLGVLVNIDSVSLTEGILLLINDYDLKKSFEHVYTIEQNIKEKQIYIEKWNNLLQI